MLLIINMNQNQTGGICVEKEYTNLNDKVKLQEENYKKVKFILWIILFANLGVAFTKIIVGYMINSTSLSTDGIHSISDGMSNVVGLIGIAIASRPVDKTHPYGHKKIEIVASLFIGGMLLLLGIKTLSNGFNGFTNPGEINITLISLISLLLTICINIFVTVYERRRGEEYNSYILISDSIHTKSDIFISIGVLISLIGIKMGLPQIIDPIISIIISLFILGASYETFKEAIGVLSDRAVIEETEVIKILECFEEVKNIHKVRSRGCLNEMYADMHIMIDSNTTTEDAHILCHNIESEIKSKINNNCQVIIHVEPYYEK